MSTTKISYGSWSLDHPVKEALIVATLTIMGGLLGIGAAVVTTDHHMVSPDNVLAGTGMGIGGSAFGWAVAVLVIAAISRRAAR